MSEDEITEARPTRRRTTKTAAPATVSAGEDLAVKAETQPARPRVRKAKSTTAAEPAVTGVATVEPAGETSSDRSAEVVLPPVNAGTAPAQSDLLTTLSSNGSAAATPVEVADVAASVQPAPPKPRTARSRSTTRKSTAAKASADQSAIAAEAAPVQPADLAATSAATSPAPAVEAPATTAPQASEAPSDAMPGGALATANPPADTATATPAMARDAAVDRTPTTQIPQRDRADSPPGDSSLSTPHYAEVSAATAPAHDETEGGTQTAGLAEIKAEPGPARPKPARRVTRRTPAKAGTAATLETAPATEAMPQGTGEATAAARSGDVPAPGVATVAPAPSEVADSGPVPSIAEAQAVHGEAADTGTPDSTDQQQEAQPLAAQAAPEVQGDFRPQTPQQRPPVQRPPFQNQQSRPAGQRTTSPFTQRPVAPTSPPAQNDFNGQVDTQRGRRRRRRRGRGGLGNAPAAGPVPNGQISAPTPTAPLYEERGAPQEFAAQRAAVVEVEGMLDFLPNGEAFLRDEDLRERSEDLLISVRDIRRFDLRNGDTVRLEARAGRGRGPVTVERVISINDIPFERMRTRMRFEDLTPIYPDRMIKLETGQLPLTTRILDLFAPVGFGQRALIVSPPKAGKTTMLKNIGTGVLANYPNASLIVCLVGERPEEVTDLRMSLPRAIMFASSFDEDVERHGHLAEMALERAKRLAEQGKDVVVLLDSITRLARAYNLGGSGGGRTLSGGMDASALTTARRIFGAARAIEQGGSLTIIATCLVDTGSRLDDVVYEEFKGTGNMELHLDRALAERRIFPAIDIGKSSTRKEELLLDPQTLQFVVALRRRLAGPQAMQATERLIESLSKTPSNRVFFDLLSRAQ